MTGTHPGEQGTGGNTSQEPMTGGGPPTPGEGKDRGHNAGERGRYKDRRQCTHPRRGDAPHRREQHHQNLPHPVNAGRPATRN